MLLTNAEVSKQMLSVSEVDSSAPGSSAKASTQQNHIAFHSEIVKKFPWARKSQQFRAFAGYNSVAFVLRDSSYGGVMDSEITVLMKERRASCDALKLDRSGLVLRWINRFENGLLFLGDSSLKSVVLHDLKLRELFLNTPGCVSLDIAYNSLSALNLSRCRAVERLDCRGNYTLESLNVAGAEMLSELYCQNCGIVALNTSNCRKLQHIDCRDCGKLRSADLSGCPALDFVCVNRCKGLRKLLARESAKLETILAKECDALSGGVDAAAECAFQ